MMAVYEACHLSSDSCYRLLSNSIGPRPIAWITTLNEAGETNAAPFSCYTFVANKPPMLAIHLGQRDGADKDTLVNARRTGTFVVNVVTESMVHTMHASAAPFAPDISEAAKLGLDILPGMSQATPRLAASPVHMECRLHSIQEFGDERAQLLIGEVLRFHVDEVVITNGKIDVAKLNLVGRHGKYYFRGADRFVLAKPEA